MFHDITKQILPVLQVIFLFLKVYNNDCMSTYYLCLKLIKLQLIVPSIYVDHYCTQYGRQFFFSCRSCRFFVAWKRQCFEFFKNWMTTTSTYNMKIFKRWYYTKRNIETFLQYIVNVIHSSSCCWLQYYYYCYCMLQPYLRKTCYF